MTPGLRLRKIVLLASDFHAVLAANGGMLQSMTTAIGEWNGDPQLRFHALRVDGINMQVFVHSEKFEPEACMCRAPLWFVNLPR